LAFALDNELLDFGVIFCLIFVVRVYSKKSFRQSCRKMFLISVLTDFSVLFSFLTEAERLSISCSDVVRLSSYTGASRDNVSDVRASQMLDNIPVVFEPNPTAQLEQDESKQTVMRLLQRLPDTYRLTFTLRYMNALSIQEIADFLSISVSAVKVRLHRARQRLKEEIIQMVQDEFEGNQLPPEFTQKVISCREQGLV